MPNVTYAPEVKKAIVSEVGAARKNGYAWKTALDVAKGIGYKGSLGGLVQLMRNATKKKARRSMATVWQNSKVASVEKSIPEAPKAVVKEKFANGVGPIIEDAINHEVGVRMNALIDKAIAVLEAAK